MLSSIIMMMANKAKTLDFVAAGTMFSGASPTVTFPAGFAAGDLLVLCVCSGGDTTTPSGWTLPTGANRGSGTTRITTFYKIAAGSETSFTLGNSNSRTSGGMLAYRPVGGAASFVSMATNDGSGTVAATGSQTVTSLPMLIVSVFCKAPNATNIGEPALGPNPRLLGTANGTLTNIRVVDDDRLALGASPSRAETASYSDVWLTNALLFTVS
ncbi:MAG: hypothetical protein Q8L60_10610 [Gammaproteobacteria bacterium]|nr:hypothetical protein [Gammaproteobacteria bacterium]MDP2346799.1 hypothetical protein [Gammaproteobacteria bacterium]